MKVINGNYTNSRDRPEEANVQGQKEQGSKLIYLVASLDQANSDNLNGIRDATMNFRNDTDELRSLISEMKEMKGNLMVR